MLTHTVASQKSRQRSRKRRNTSGAPRAVPSTRRDARAERRTEAALELKRGSRHMGREGERPEGLFGPIPVSELAMLIGFVALIVGFFNGGGPVVIVGLIVCGLGVVEVTAREHFSGFRAHNTLLAAVPAVVLAVAIVTIFGAPKQRVLVVVFIAPVFAVSFWLLRRRFAHARQARVARHGRGAQG